MFVHFTADRAALRLLFDFSVMASLLKSSVLESSILQLGAGTVWSSELSARFQAVSFDTHGDLQSCLENRAQADYRINERFPCFVHGDWNPMPVESSVFGPLLCYKNAAPYA